MVFLSLITQTFNYLIRQKTLRWQSKIISLKLKDYTLIKRKTIYGKQQSTKTILRRARIKPKAVGDLRCPMTINSPCLFNGPRDVVQRMSKVKGKFIPDDILEEMRNAL